MRLTCCGGYNIIPQPEIDYLLGLNVTKQLNHDHSRVELKIVNALPDKVDWYWILEKPNIYFDFDDITDNIKFRPYELIFNKLISAPNIEWAPLSHYLGIFNRASDFNISVSIIDEFKSEVEKYLNPYFSRFSYTFLNPNIDIPNTWAPANYQGLFSMGYNLEPLETRYLTFNLWNSSYLINDASTISVSATADVSNKELGESSYSYKSQTEIKKETIELNPSKYFTLRPNSKCDMFVNTCFSDNNIAHFYEQLNSNPINFTDLWKTLNSEDIVLTNNDRRIGGKKLTKSFRFRPRIKVKISNGGKSDGNCTANIKTIFFPIIKVEESYKFGIPFYSSASNAVFVESSTSKERNISYSQYFTGSLSAYNRVKIPKELLSDIYGFIAINIVNLESENDAYKANNNSVEIVKFLPRDLNFDGKFPKF
jgi:hypothetical protein